MTHRTLTSRPYMSRIAKNVQRRADTINDQAEALVKLANLTGNQNEDLYDQVEDRIQRARNELDQIERILIQGKPP